MKQYFFTISSIIILFFSLCSCSQEESKTQSEKAARVRPLVVAPTVKIGTQVWMSQNLNVSKYRNGDIIPQVTDPTEWANLSEGAWCYYENSTANGSVYGKLYNWNAVTDPRGLAPLGFHIPSDVEWTTLTNYIGGYTVAGGKMKTTGTLEAGTGLWQNPNYNASNSSRFSCLPAGYRYNGNGIFATLGTRTQLWSSTEKNITDAYYLYLGYSISSGNIWYGNKFDGCSVRCIKD